MDSKKLAPQDITKAQRRWLNAERKRTGNPITIIIRSLLQEKVDEAKGK